MATEEKTYRTVDKTAETGPVVVRAPHPDAETSRSTTSDWERAGAVIERLFDRLPRGQLTIGMRVNLTMYVAQFEWMDGASYPMRFGSGPTVVAALLDLGAKLDESHD